MGATRLADSALRAALLRRIGAPLPAREALIAAARELAAGLPGARAQACAALDGSFAYLYAWLPPGQPAVPAADAIALRPHAAWRGAAAGTPARFHYIVETDVEPQWDDELNRWYDTEHMPGLAAVPGNALSSRLTCDGSPRYHACYDIESPQVLARPEWLAVRHTDWSSRVRPHFRNTVRLMCESLTEPPKEKRKDEL